MYYSLMVEPNGGVLLAAFDAIDEVYGTETFTSEQAITAISEVCDVNYREAEGRFDDLVYGGYVVC